MIASPLVWTAVTADGSERHITYDWTSVGARAVRKLRIEWERNFTFKGAYVLPTESLHKAPNPNIKCAILGDSYASNSGATWHGDGFPGGRGRSHRAQRHQQRRRFDGIPIKRWGSDHHPGEDQ